MNAHIEKQSNKSEKGLHCHLSPARKKWVKISFFVSIGIGIFTIVMFRLRPDWQIIVFGTLAFLVGSALLVWTAERKEGEFLKWQKGVIVPIFFAVGGLLTTHGWNLRNNYFSDRARFVAMAAELKLKDGFAGRP